LHVDSPVPALVRADGDVGAELPPQNVLNTRAQFRVVECHCHLCAPTYSRSSHAPSPPRLARHARIAPPRALPARRAHTATWISTRTGAPTVSDRTLVLPQDP